MSAPYPNINIYQKPQMPNCYLLCQFGVSNGTFVYSCNIGRECQSLLDCYVWHPSSITKKHLFPPWILSPLLVLEEECVTLLSFSIPVHVMPWINNYVRQWYKSELLISPFPLQRLSCLWPEPRGIQTRGQKE